MSGVTPERWRRLKELFGAALDRTGAERDAFVASACAGDPTLAAELAALLASHEGAPGFLETPACAPARRLGPYELVREIGHGGMGTVFLAARVDREYRKDVAIKIIRRGMDTVVRDHRLLARR